jgi:hypothetical protein
VSLRVCHIVQVHVASDSCLLLDSFTVVNFGLGIRAADQKVFSLGTPAQRSDRVSINRLKVLEGAQILIHSLKVKNLELIVQASRSHLVSLPVDL